MPEYDGQVLLNTKIDDKDAQKRLRELEKSVDQLKSRINRKTAEKSVIAEDLRNARKEAEALEEQLKKINEVRTAQQAYGAKQVERVALKGRINDLSKEAGAALEKYAALESQGASKNAQRYQDQYNVLTAKIREAEAAQQSLNQELEREQGILTAMYQSIGMDDKAGMAGLNAAAQDFEGKIKKANKEVEHQEKLERNVEKEIRIANAELETQNQEIDQINSKLTTQSVKAWPKVREEADKAMGGVSDSMKKGLKALVRYGLGMRSLFVLYRKLRSVLIDGIKEYANVDEQTRNSLNNLKASLNGLKGSFVSAFAPIVNAVVPILVKLIDWVTAAANAVSMFFAILSGKSTYKKAVKGLNNVADAASGAGAAAAEAAKNFSGLDEVNIWNSGSSGAGGGGGGGGGGAAGELAWEEVPVDAEAAEKVKGFFEDWKNSGYAWPVYFLDDEDDGWLNKRVRELRAKVEQAVRNVFHVAPVELPSVIAAPEEDAWERLREGIREKVREPVAVPAAIRVPDSAVEGLKSTVTSAVNRLFASEPVTVPAEIRVPSTATEDVTAELSKQPPVVTTATIRTPSTATETITDDLALQEPVVTTATIRTPSTATETITDDLASQQPVVTPLTIRTPANATSEIAEELAKQDPVTLPAAIQVKAVDISEEEIDHLRSIVNEAFSRAFGGSGDSEAIEIPGPTLAENIFMAAVGSAFFPGWLESLLGGSPEGALGGFAADAGFDLDAFLEEHQLGEGEGRGGRLVGRYAMDETPRIPVIAEFSKDRLNWDAWTTPTTLMSSKFSDKLRKWNEWTTPSTDMKSNLKDNLRNWKAWTTPSTDIRSIFKNSTRDWSKWTTPGTDIRSIFQNGLRDWSKWTRPSTDMLAKLNDMEDDINPSRKWISGIGAGIAAVTNAMRWDGAGYGTVSGVAAGIKSFDDQIPWYEKLLYHFKAVIDQYSNNGNQLASGGVFTGGAWRAIQSYASGGYVGGQLFVAREAGPELVGTLKGHTAVMNNDQIVASVSAGVAKAISSIRFQLAGLPAYPAVTPGMMPAMAAGTVIPPGILRSEEDIGGIRDAVGRILDRLEGLNAGGTGDISVNARVRERTLFEVVIEQGRLYKARTGRSPFDV